MRCARPDIRTAHLQVPIPSATQALAPALADLCTIAQVSSLRYGARLLSQGFAYAIRHMDDYLFFVERVFCARQMTFFPSTSIHPLIFSSLDCIEKQKRQNPLPNSKNRTSVIRFSESTEYARGCTPTGRKCATAPLYCSDRPPFSDPVDRGNVWSRPNPDGRDGQLSGGLSLWSPCLSKCSFMFLCCIGIRCSIA
jgi:hypothetical protein